MEEAIASDETDGTSRRLRAIGKYQLIARLGQGGMATVYLAAVAGPAGFSKLMVVKVLRNDLMDGSQEAVRMFWDEARLSAQLVHPNIVHTFEVGQADSRYFLAMEYLDGQSYRALQDRAAEHGGVPLPESLRILSEAARGLHYSHQLKSRKGEPLGVVHRDVSPHNLFVTYDGQVKVLDFGIAKMRDAEHQTQVGMIKGKLEYLAPEQLRCEPLDGRADVFALGAMLWEAITGDRFAGGRKVPEHGKVHARLVGGERKIRDLKPDTPEPLMQIVERAIALDPGQRFESAGAFADALEAYIEHVGRTPTSKSLAAFIEPLFEDDRRRMHLKIDEQLELLENDTSSTRGLTELPSFDGDTSSRSYSGSGNNTVGSAVRHKPDQQVLETFAKSKRGRTLGWMAAGIVAVVGIWLGSRSVEPRAKPLEPEPARSPITGITATAPVREGPAQSQLQHTILLQVNVTPPTARVSLNGAPLVTPFSGRFPESSAFHQIEAVADGFRPFKSIIPFDHDQTIDIVLEADAPQSVTRRGSPRTPSRGRSAEPRTADRQDPPVEAAPTPPPVAKPQEPPPPTNDGPEGNRSVRDIKRRGLIEADPYAKPSK